MQDAVIFLQNYDITIGLSVKIYEQYIAGKIKTENIIEQFKQQIGLIDISKI